MQTRRFGRHNREVSSLGYGMWGIGQPEEAEDKRWLSPRKSSDGPDSDPRSAIHAAIESGCTFFDTALAYGGGTSERLLASVLREHPDRDVCVATKVPPSNGRWPASANDRAEDIYPTEHILECARRSRENLGVERLDLLQLHGWSDAWAGASCWQEAATRLKDEGHIEGFGISVNRWEPENVVKAIETGLIDSVQVVYNIFDQAPEDVLFPICREYDVAIIARVPFDEGSLTDVLRPDSTWPEGDWRNTYFAPDALAETLRRLDGIKTLLREGMTLPQLALRFILSNPKVSTTIAGMRRVANVHKNVAAAEAGPLPAELVDALREHRWDRVDTGAGHE